MKSQTIDQLKKQHQALQETLNEMYLSVMYLLFAEGNDIKYADLNNATHGISNSLPSVGKGTILTVRRDAPRLIFDVNFSKGAILPKHFHSDCSERAICKKGSFIIICTYPDGEEGHFKLSEGEELMISNGIYHQFNAVGGDGVLEIEFIKVWKGFQL